jgi:hypothetical protein
MKRTQSLVMVLLVAAVVAPCLGREPLTVARVKEQSIADAATPEGKAYLKEFFTNPWMLAMDAADEQCRAAAERSSAGMEEFEIALSIGLNGYPAEALVTPDNEYMRCQADRLKATGFIKPPHDAFAIYMKFKHTEPGTEHQAAAQEPASDQK